MTTTYKIPALDKEMGKQVFDYIQTLTKPINSLGRLEEIAVSLAEMKAEPFPTVTPPAILVFAADHGIAKENVSAYPQEVTAQMVQNFLSGGAAINVFSRQIGAMLRIIDIGVASDIEDPQLIQRKIRYGTGNYYHEDAMTRKEAEEAIAVGYEEGLAIVKKGAQALIVGEMGIGNTTTSSAILAVLSNENIANLVGAGTGISEDRLAHKAAIIQESINRRKPDRNDPIDIIQKIGGLEIAGMAGAMLAAAQNRVPILIDGLICSVAALLAKEIEPVAADYFIVTHKSVEPGHRAAISLLGKKTIIDLDMRLGEGTGAAVTFPIIESATLMVKEMATFQGAGISNKN